VVRVIDGDSKAFGLRVGVHQGSVLSPILFVIVLEVHGSDHCLPGDWVTEVK